MEYLRSHRVIIALELLSFLWGGKKMKRFIAIFFVILFVCSPMLVLSESLPLDEQPVSDIEDLFDIYFEELMKSEYETMAQYETRVEEFFSNEPIRYFDIKSDTKYDAETQTLHVYVYNWSAPSCDPEGWNLWFYDCYDCHVVLPPDWEVFRLHSYTRYGDLYTYSVIINNPNHYYFELGEVQSTIPPYPWLSCLYIYSVQLLPTIAEDLSDNLKIRIGMKFNYVPDKGMICKEIIRHYDDVGILLYSDHDHYLLGELQIITVYDDRDDSIYWQDRPAPPVGNEPPVTNAGSDQTVDEGVTVTLDGSNSSDPDNGIASWQWTQTDGISVTLSDSTATQPTFIAPDVNEDGESLTFQLTVTDTGGLDDSDTCIVYVTNVEEADNDGDEVDEPQNGDDVGDSRGDGGCFIATAAYGSRMAKQVVVLSNLRDNVLSKSSLRRSFVKFYYEISPPLADYIGEHEILRTATRLSLTPIAYGVKNPKTSVLIFFSIFIAITLTLGIRKSNRF